jgi:hypothetical protein
MTAFLAELVRHPNRYAFSVHENMLRNGERVTIFWANKGIFDDQGEVREVLRVGVDMTERKHISWRSTSRLTSKAQTRLERFRWGHRDLDWERVFIIADESVLQLRRHRLSTVSRRHCLC